MAMQASDTTAAPTARRAKRFRSKQERRQIVEETLKPGASVSLVARAHDVNTNQVFKWRRLYQQGHLSDESTATLLPIKVTDATEAVQSRTHGKSKGKMWGIIDIDLGHARVRIEGAADPECVRAALEGLIR
jgi:transposase